MNEPDPEQDVPPEVHTVCPLCGGGGMIADPKQAIIGGEPRTVDNGRACGHCATDGHFPGIVPPV
ncbi:hypothetical protein [Actinokineospora enzanensis]|uniref:hypothetical protein n=1 Tax=Actinokineospora enzanensis TaxID=155975 RepID=UPI0003702410|nr:hypothetical protein [Actinokineospora enzanensis]